jgi:hypothetical protein
VLLNDRISLKLVVFGRVVRCQGEAEYWDNRGINKLQYMFESARAYVKGETPDVTDIDQHGKTKL